MGDVKRNVTEGFYAADIQGCMIGKINRKLEKLIRNHHLATTVMATKGRVMITRYDMKHYAFKRIVEFFNDKE